MAETPEVIDSPTDAVVVREPMSAPMPVAPEKPPGLTAAQGRIDAIANLTHNAYAKASELRLTPEECSALEAPFNDDDFLPGAAGKEQLIYIKHSALRARLNKILGLGQWSIVQRSRWAQENGKSTTIYFEGMLVIRGCYVAEKIGDMVYWPNNPGTNFGDAVEGAETQCLRRCCKQLGVGLQAWDPDWCRGWWERRNSTQAIKPLPRPATAPSSPAPAPAKPATTWRTPPPEVAGEEVVKCHVKMVSEKTGVSASGKAWKATFVLLNDGTNDLEAGTFNSTLAGMARTLAETGDMAEVTMKPGKRPGTMELVSMIPIPLDPAQDDVPMP